MPHTYKTTYTHGAIEHFIYYIFYIILYIYIIFIFIWIYIYLYNINIYYLYNSILFNILYINTKTVPDFVSVDILIGFIQWIRTMHSLFLLDKHRSTWDIRRILKSLKKATWLCSFLSSCHKTIMFFICEALINLVL